MVDPITSAKPESCVTCHRDQGTEHQDVYKDYLDAKTKSKYTMSFEDVTGDGAIINVSGPVSGNYTITVEFRITKNGLPYNDPTLGGLNQKRFAIHQHFEGAQYQFQGQASEGRPYTTSLGTFAFLGDGKYTVSSTSAKWDPRTAAGYQAYGYIAEGVLETEGMTLYADVADDGLAFGTANNYSSTAVVEGCELCHGAPYLKHGYRAAKVDGLKDFAACKECHYDDRVGSHRDWQQMVDQPYEWATGVAADPVKYAYRASVMQDTHQTHAMEFPYPMSMANCVTCHKGKLDRIITDANFKIETCKSCHPVDGKDAWGAACTDTLPGTNNPDLSTPCYAQNNRPPALAERWAAAGVASFHSASADCATCHKTGGVGSTFNEYHNGYDVRIYNASGQRYADLNKVTIDSVSLTGDKLDIKFSSANAAIVPEVTVSFYGYDAAQMLVSSHTRDGGARDCGTSTCRFELELTATPAANRLFTIMADSKPGAWHVQANLGAYVQPTTTGLKPIMDMIAAGQLKKSEIVVIPALAIGGEEVALNAATYTYDLVGKAAVPNYYQGTKAIVSAAKCNACHDALGTTFHSPGYGGNVTVCRTCHVTTSAGSHLEMQSRGIDSYVHAIHKFQAFDPGDIDFTNPVFAKRYALHVEHTFPNFTIKNCEACHVTPSSTVPVTYNPADQTKSMPGLESGSDVMNKGWVDLATGASLPNGKRNIGTIPRYVVGPSNRACGGCHRAVLINEDAAGELISFNSHTDAGGYTIENGQKDGVDYVYAMIDKIMNYYK